MKTITLRILLCSTIVWATLNGSRAGESQQMEWKSKGGGSFQSPESWKGGKVPGPGNPAAIVVRGDCPISFEDNAQITKLHVSGTDDPLVTLDLNGHSLNISSSVEKEGSFYLGPQQGGKPVECVIKNGTLSAQSASINFFASDKAPLALLRIAENARFQFGTLTVGVVGLGEVSIEPGCQVEDWRKIILGGAPGSNGVLRVRGTGALLQCAEDAKNLRKALPAAAIHVGASGSGLLEVTDGASARTGILNLGCTSRMAKDQPTEGTGHGKALISGANTLVATKETYIGGGKGRADAPAFPDGSGEMEISDRGKLEADVLRVMPKGRLKLDGGTAVVTGMPAAPPSPGVGAKLDAGSTVVVVLHPGMKSAPLHASSISLGGAKLQLELASGFAPAAGTSFPLISYDSREGEPFADLPEGSTLMAGSTPLQISYSASGINARVKSAR